MGIFPGQPITNSAAHLTFFFLGLSSTLVYPILDLNCFVLLRFLGTTTYDADSMTFLVKRLNQIIGLSSSILLFLVGKESDCSYWSWFLFLSYMGGSFYVYSLTQSYIFVGKTALLLVFLISLGSHGLLMSSIKLMFSRSQRYLSNNPSWRFYIFTAGSFFSCLLLKVLAKLNAGDPFSDFDSDNTLVLFNRLFVCFTLIILATCFLLSGFSSTEVEREKHVPTTSFMESLFMNNIWVFITACFAWASTPLLNNLGLAVLHTIPRKQALSLQYYQFNTCLVVTFIIFFSDHFDLESYKKGGYIYNSLYRSVCLMLRYRSFTPIDPKETRHQDIREDMDLMSKVLKIRLFRDPQPWPMAPYGFWSEWEEYDNFDLTRIFNILGMYMSITDIRNQDPFKSDAYYVLRFTRRPTPQENYRTIKKHKYTLLWLTCSFINYCNILITKIEKIFAFSQCTSPQTCCASQLTTSSNCCCMKKCLLQELTCSGGCCCSTENCNILSSYIKNALKGCVEDANALLFDINSSPDLADSLIVNYEDMMFSLGVFEELLLRLVVILVYGRIADEYLTIQKYIGPVCCKLAKDCKKYKEKCTCQNSEAGNPCKCCCTMYCKMLQCVCKLHFRQKQACDIMKGTSLENLIDVMPPISLSRAVLILGSIFHEIIESEFLYEDGNCNCQKAQEQGKCCCLGNMLCYCCRFNSRIDDILSLMLQALDKVTDCDAILTNVIKVMSSFTSFKYPVKFYEGIYPIDGIPPDDEAAADSSNILSVFANIYTQFSDLMSVLLPPGHFRPGTSCCWIDESGLCKCIRTLLEIMREVCCMIDKVSGEIGNTSVSVCYILNYNKIEELYKRLSCSAEKFKCFASKVKSCNCFTCTCCAASSSNINGFVEKLGESLCSTIKLVEELNKQSKESIKSLSTSLQNELAELNRKNTNIYNSIRGTRMGMMTEPCKMMSKMITYYKNTIVGRVPDYGSNSFYFFLIVSLICLVCIYVGILIPYVRNMSKYKRYRYLIVIYSILTSYYLNSSFGFLSSFGDESAYYVSLAIILGLVISIIYSWLTQWFTYRMFLYEQFTELYNKFRLLFPGSRYLYNPPFLWWIEGFVSFLAMDMVSMKNLITFTKSKETYNPFNFGFTTRLNVTYDIVESEPHIFTEDECLKNIKKTVFQSQYIDFLKLLEYRSFYHLYSTDCSFLKRESIKEINYPMDLLYHAWVLGFTVGDLSDRLYTLRELALKSVEKTLQRQATANKYDMKSINTLKIFFEFQHECLLEAPKLAVQDSFYKSQHFLTVQSRKLVKLYERVYTDKWNIFLQDYEDKVTQKRGMETLIPDVKMEQLVQLYESWILVKKRHCDMRYGRNEICKLAVQRTSEEFEEYLYKPIDVSDVLTNFMKFVSTSYTVKDIPKSFEVLKYLSKPVNPLENREVKPILEKIAQLIRGHSFGYRSSIITDFLGVCKNIEIESEMVDTIYKHETYLVGEWLRWQGLNVPGDMVLVIIQFLVF